MSKRIYLLTGAAGFLGSTICRQLISRGESVRALVLPNDPYAKYLPEQTDICEGDLSKRESMDTFFTVHPETEVYVIHCGSIVTVNPTFSQKVYDVNVVGTENVLYYCDRMGKQLRSLVYVGSTGTLGSKSGNQEYTEPTYFNPSQLPDCYSRTKAEASNRVLDAAQRGMNACIVMPTGILGPDDHSNSTTTSTLVEIIHGTMPMGIDGSFNLADVRDLAGGVILATEHGKRGECYILGNKVVSFRSFAKLIAEAAGTKPMTVFLPCWVARLMAQLSEWRCRRNGKKPLLTTYSVDVLAQSNNFSSAKANHELGYTCRPYTETIQDEVRFLRKEGMI